MRLTTKLRIAVGAALILTGITAGFSPDKLWMWVLSGAALLASASYLLIVLDHQEKNDAD